MGACSSHIHPAGWKDLLLCLLTAAITAVLAAVALGVLMWGVDFCAGDVSIVAGSVTALATPNQFVVWAEASSRSRRSSARCARR